MISPYIDQGTGVMRFDLPEKWRLKKVLEPSSSSNALDQASISNLIHKRLDSPAFNSKLEKSKNCVVMTDDVERPTPIHLLLSPLLSRLENHFDRDNIKVVVATGSHQTSNKDSIVKKLGKDVCDGFSVHIHSARDDGNMYLGETKQGTPVYIDGVVIIPQDWYRKHCLSPIGRVWRGAEDHSPRCCRSGNHLQESQPCRASFRIFGKDLWEYHVGGYS